MLYLIYLQCHNLAESHESSIEEWFLNYKPENSKNKEAEIKTKKVVKKAKTKKPKNKILDVYGRRTKKNKKNIFY